MKIQLESSHWAQGFPNPILWFAGSWACYGNTYDADGIKGRRATYGEQSFEWKYQIEDLSGNQQKRIKR